MRDLVLAVQKELRRALGQVHDRDVIILEDEDLLPESLGYPAIGIKDGPVTWTPETGRSYDQGLTVRITAMVALGKQGEAVVDKAGALALAEKAQAALLGNLLGLAGYYLAQPGPEEPSKWIYDGKRDIQRKTITINYRRERTV
ncbi:MAG: hypothetical protein AB1568_04745 [Thermodesulfobacteriota bacterium]